MRTPQRHWRDITQRCRITSKVNNRICAAYLGGISDFYYKLRPRSKERDPDCRKTSIVIQKWGLGRSPKAGRRDASLRIHPRHGCRACMHKGFARCKANQHTQPFTGERGFRQGCRNKDTPSFKHGCLQVVEQSRCRTHRQQTTTVAQRQSHQSVLKGIGIINQKFISKTDFFYKLDPAQKSGVSFMLVLSVFFEH